MNQYIGNEDDEQDNACARVHGTIRVNMYHDDKLNCDVLAVESRIHDEITLEMETMTLLIPDRDRNNQDDFIWCVPIDRQKWNKWYALSQKFKTAVPKEHGGVRYMNRMEGKHVRTVLVMPNEEQSDDEAVQACAFLRMVKELSCRMYIVRCTDDPLTGARLINKAAGADVTLVEDVEFTDEGATTNKAS